MRLIVWGLPLHSHTHSYIHNAFARASREVGIDSYWVDNKKEFNSFIRPGDVVICCGVADSELNAIKDVSYVLHNSDREDIRQHHHINLQVYTHDVLKRDCEKIESLTYWQNSNRTLYQPWATDLLPREIANITPVDTSHTFREFVWIGSVMDGVHGNHRELSRYAELCHMNSVQLKIGRGVSIEENVQAIRMSRHAPALQGKWQVDKGYVPCRVLKNISYGALSFTNSKTVAELLEMDHAKDIDTLYEMSESHCSKPCNDLIAQKMLMVAERHTYINRLNRILEALRR